MVVFFLTTRVKSPGEDDFGGAENSVKIPERKKAHEFNIKSGILAASELVDICILQIHIIIVGATRDIL